MNGPDQSENDAQMIELYELAIRALADSQGEALFENSGPEHAAIVFSNMFRTAADSIFMYTGSLEGPVSGQAAYVRELEGFLKRGKSLTIVFENEPNRESKAFKLLSSDMYSRMVRMYRYTSAEKAEKPHFAVADGRMFRLEEDKHEYKAMCSFNNTEYSKRLLEYSRYMLEQSEVI